MTRLAACSGSCDLLKADDDSCDCNEGEYKCSECAANDDADGASPRDARSRGHGDRHAAYKLQRAVFRLQTNYHQQYLAAFRRA